MKKSLILFLCFSTFAFSQNIYTSKNGKILENGKKIDKNYIETAFSNAEILKQYNAGKTKQFLGNFLFYGGIGTVAIKHLSMLSKHKGAKNPDTNNTMYFVGFGMIATSIPVKIGYSKKIKKAAELMNEEIKNQKQSSIESVNIIANENGFGVSLKF